MAITPAECRAGRALLDWTQRQLAEAANVAPATIADFENGKRKMVHNNRRAVERAFNDNDVWMTPEGGIRHCPPSGEYHRFGDPNFDLADMKVIDVVSF